MNTPNIATDERLAELSDKACSAIATGLSNKSEPENITIDPRVFLDLVTRMQESEMWTKPHECSEKHEEPYDFDYCETHDKTYEQGGHCPYRGLSELQYLEKTENEQRFRAIKAEDQLEELKYQISQES